MTYSVKEIFLTLQGEGARAGRVSVFCRFSGCNLWSGREEDRLQAACRFCDTDFVGTDGNDGGKFTCATDLISSIERIWGPEKRNRYVVFTGGEPLLQLDAALIGAAHDAGFEVAVETNGTLLPPDGVDWICVSPKGKSDWILRSGNELKLVFPQTDLMPEQIEGTQFDSYYLQPMDGVSRAENTEQAIRYCLKNPQWSLSLQTHKMIGIP